MSKIGPSLGVSGQEADPSIFGGFFDAVDVADGARGSFYKSCIRSARVFFYF